MRLEELTRYHIPQSLIDGWRKRQGDMLLPLQAEALRQGLLGGGSGPERSLLISAPTSTGKTFCAELALAGAIVRQRKGALLVPLKSLAEEKFAEFEPLYRRLRLKCIVATADHPEYNRALQRGDFDIAICVYEKFNRALVSNIDLLGRLGVVIIDEAQLLTDAERGPVLERILLKITGYRRYQCDRQNRQDRQAAPDTPRLIALTASLASDTALALRLDAQLIRETRRPVELRQGILFDGTYRYFNRNTGEIGSEKSEQTFASPAPANPTEALLRRLRADRSPKLVFLSGRRQVIDSALALAADVVGVGWSPARTALAELSGEEPSSVVRSLCQALTCGVAFHSSDLTSAQRRAVERGFRSGEISVIFCTTTLGLGVNLPAETVYIEPMKYSAMLSANADSSAGVRTGAIPLPRAEFDNIAGRAGRYHCRIEEESATKLHADCGAKRGAKPAPLIARAILLAHSEFERDVLWENYIEPPHSPSSESARTADTPQTTDLFALLALELVVCGLATTVTSLSGICCRNADSYTTTATVMQPGATVTETVRRLCALGFLDADSADSIEAGALRASALGRAVAGSGLSLDSATQFASALKHIHPTEPREWLALALSAPDFLKAGAVAPTGPYSSSGSDAPRRLFGSLPDSAERLLTALAGGRSIAGASHAESNAPARLSRQMAVRIHALLTFEAWRAGESARVIETRYQTSLAQVARLAQSARWLLQGLMEVAIATGALHPESEIALKLTAMLDSLRYGLPPNALSLRETLTPAAGGSSGESGTSKANPRSPRLSGGPDAGPELFNRAELMELARSNCRNATDIAVLLADSGLKVLNGASINPAMALKHKQRRLAECLEELGQPGQPGRPGHTPTPSANTKTKTKADANRQHTTINSQAKERLMRDQTPHNATSAGLPSTISSTRVARPSMQTPYPANTPGLIPCSVQLDGAARGERFLALIDGLPVALTGKSFKYLVKLACARLSQPDGWIYKDDIEVGFNQARYLYRMRREISAQLPGYRWSVYENNRLGYYRLALDAVAVDVNRKTLADSPDYEVAETVGALPTAVPEISSTESTAAVESRRFG